MLIFVNILNGKEAMMRQ